MQNINYDEPKNLPEVFIPCKQVENNLAIDKKLRQAENNRLRMRVYKKYQQLEKQNHINC